MSRGKLAKKKMIIVEETKKVNKIIAKCDYNGKPISDRVLTKIYRKKLYKLFYAIFPQGSNVFYFYPEYNGFSGIEIENNTETRPAIVWQGKNPFVFTSYEVNQGQGTMYKTRPVEEEIAGYKEFYLQNYITFVK